MTSEEEGRAKPPLSAVPSSASLSSACELSCAVRLVGRLCLCRRCEQDPQTGPEGGEKETARAEENGEHEPGVKPQRRH